MDGGHFDALARTLSGAGSRRRLIAALGTLPLFGVLVALFDDDDSAEARKRRKRRKRRNTRRSGSHKKNHHRKHRRKKKACVADSLTQTCAGNCGAVTNNCQQSVDCGSCACEPACGPCFVCSASTRTCVVDASQAGQACGSIGQVCTSEGTCVCTPTTCAAQGAVCGEITDGCGETLECGLCTNPAPVCNAGVCRTCSTSRPCPTGQCCAEDGSCGRCLVFLTSTVYKGNLGGLTGADALCQFQADSVNQPGEYKAWLADSTGSPSTGFVQATVPYVTTTGITIANNWDDLIDGALAAPINVTEAGVTLAGGGYVWTNANPNGTAGGFVGSRHCLNWSIDTQGFIGSFGESDRSNEWWTAYGAGICSLNHRLYCFQQR